MLELLKPSVASERLHSTLDSAYLASAIGTFVSSTSALNALVFSYDRQYPSDPIPLGFLAPLTLLSYLAIHAQSCPGIPFHEPAFHLRLSIGMIGRMAKSLPIAQQRLIELRNAANATGIMGKDEDWGDYRHQ